MELSRPCTLALGALTLTLSMACKEPADGDVTGDSTGASTAGSTGTTEADSTGVTGSSGDETPTGSATDGEAVRPNWHQDIAPLAAMHCRNCHTEGGIAPFAMSTYAETLPWANAMSVDVELATMPPWHALETDECQPPFSFKHDARLTDEEKALFIDWAKVGAPEGDPGLAAPVPEPPTLDLADVSATAMMGSEVTVPAAGQVRDYFNCLSIDPGNTESVYLDGIQVIAGNRAIVHHVLIYVDSAAESAGWAGGVKKDCGGGAGIQSKPQLIAGWVPGSMPIETPADVGTELKPGTRLIMNVHYHALANAEKDSGTGLALRWKTEEPAWTSLFALVGAPGVGDPQTGPLMIPAGEAKQVESFVWTVNFPKVLDVRLWTALNHMHKFGVDLRVSVEDGETGVETCLLQTPKWDYNWQRSYAYDVPIEQALRIRGGDKVHVRCTYNNTLENPGVGEVLAELGLDAPFDVVLGEGTNNEMCLSGLGVAVKGGL